MMGERKRLLQRDQCQIMKGEWSHGEDVGWDPTCISCTYKVRALSTITQIGGDQS